MSRRTRRTGRTESIVYVEVRMAMKRLLEPLKTVFFRGCILCRARQGRHRECSKSKSCEDSLDQHDESPVERARLRKGVRLMEGWCYMARPPTAALAPEQAGASVIAQYYRPRHRWSVRVAS